MASMLALVPIIVALFAKLGNKLPGRALQCRNAAFAATPAAACETATELAGGGDDQTRQGFVRQRGNQFVQFGKGQARGQRVDAVA